MSGTATHVTEWSIIYTDDEGIEHTKWFPLELSRYGGGATLWQVDPQLDDNDFILICDRGVLLNDPVIVNAVSVGSDADVPTIIPTLVEVFAANADGSVKSMSTIREPISLTRGPGGINMAQVLSALGYQENQ